MSISRRSFIKGLTVAGAASVVPGELVAREPIKAGPDDVGMLFDSTKCIGCRACEAKCRDANDLPPARRSLDGAPYDAPLDLSDTTVNIIKLYKREAAYTFVKNQCMHCIDPACVSVCPAAAMHLGEKGIVCYDPSLCIGCRYCQVACPYDVPKFNWNAAFPKIVKCEMCRHREEGAACAQFCPTGATTYGLYNDLLEESHKRRKEDFDRYNPKTFGLTDGGGTHVLYMVPRGMSYEELGFPELTDEPLPQMSETVQHRLYQGLIAPVALYAMLTFVQFKNRKKKDQHEGAEAKEDRHE